MFAQQGLRIDCFQRLPNVQIRIATHPPAIAEVSAKVESFLRSTNGDSRTNALPLAAAVFVGLLLRRRRLRAIVIFVIAKMIESTQLKSARRVRPIAENANNRHGASEGW